MNTLASPSNPIRVLVLGLDPLLQTGVCAALEMNALHHVQFQPSNQTLSEYCASDSPPDVIITDIENGLQIVRQRNARPHYSAVKNTRVFILDANSLERDVRTSLEAGVHGYASLTLSLEQLYEGVRIVAKGGRYLCPRTAQRLADSMTTEALTQRENDVLLKLARGICNKTIANQLNVSTGTVKAHMKSLMLKLEARTRTEVLAVAISKGLIDPWSVEHVTEAKAPVHYMGGHRGALHRTQELSLAA